MEPVVTSSASATLGVEGSASGVNSSADPVHEVGSGGALSADWPVEGSAERVVVGSLGIHNTVVSSEGVPVVAGQTVSVGVVPGVAESVNSCADSIEIVGSGGTLLAIDSCPE